MEGRPSRQHGCDLRHAKDMRPIDFAQSIMEYQSVGKGGLETAFLVIFTRETGKSLTIFAPCVLSASYLK